jgi:peptide/nickel transport system substrate-binding protein
MTHMSGFRRVLAGSAVVVFALAGCSSTKDAPPPAAGNAEVGTTSDVNPRDPASLRDGGNLRLALTSLPPTFNTLHVDGNLGELGGLLRPTMPRAFIISPDGKRTVNTDYFTSVELTSTDPQTVTYTINPKAVWTDGTPITWEDIAAQINATNLKDKRFLINAPNGSDRVEKVTKGVDDRQAVMTFSKHYADWQGMFAGNSMLYPKSVTSDPEVFNKGLLDRPGPSAGPFVVTTVDKGAQRIVLTRNPEWWGAKPRLDSITYSVLDDAARIPALQNNALDAAALITIDELTIARRTPGVAIRRAPSASWYHFTFNGAPGAVLSDPKLRLAVARGIDRQAIANVTQRGLVDNPRPLNNHIYVAGQEGYQDNSAAVAFDPEKAKAELDALGWKQNGQFREKDGKRLVIRDVFYDAASTRQVAQIAQNNLAQIGVQFDLVPAAGGRLFSEFVLPGNFDVAQFAFAADAFALSSLTQTYVSNAEGNVGKIGSPEIDAKIEETLAELDQAKARDLANEVDTMLFETAHSLPLFQSAGNVAVRSTLANFGPAGIGDLNYTAIGFTE